MTANSSRIVSALVAICFVLTDLASIRSLAENDVVETKTGQRVDADATVADANIQQKNAQGGYQLKDAEGKIWVHVLSKTFVPGTNKVFKTFEDAGAQRSPNAPWKYVDIQFITEGNCATGVLIGPDGKPCESPGAIQIYALFRADQTSDVFPLRAEGNIGAGGGGGGAGQATHPFWRVKVNKQGCDQARLLLEADYPVVYRKRINPNQTGWGMPKLTAHALDGSGNAVSNVTVTFDLWKLTQQGGQDVEVEHTWQTRATEPAIIDAHIYPDASEPYEVVIKARATNYPDAVLRLPYRKASWIERSPLYRGFTPGTPAWIVLGIGDDLKSTSSSLDVSGREAQDQVDLSLAAGIAALPPNPNPYHVAGGAARDIDFTGITAGETLASAKVSGTTIAELQVAVKKTKAMNLQVVLLKRKNGTEQGQLADNTRDDAENAWARQAVVTYTNKDPVPPLEIDVPANPTIDAVWDALDGQPLLQGTVTVFVAWDYTVTGEVARAMYGRVLIKSSSDAQTLAHEIGHALGYPNHSPRAGGLMAGWGASQGRRIEKWEADIVNHD